ncbi:threonine dehydratase [Mycobacteroides abscessus subsp. abscessus]|nr:threonine dehydratase [Mycobacteroides abscessus subsp. abscessus]
MGIELSYADDLSGLLDRMRLSGLDIERLEPDSPAFRYLT